MVPPETLRQFCDDSVTMLGWLESHGVPFEGSLCPDKTSYPTNRHYLYYSGSEMSARAVAPPAPRGHRTRGRGTSGGLLFARLAAATRRGGGPGGRAERGRPPDHGRRPGDGRGVPFAARRALVGAHGAPLAAQCGPQALPVRPEGRPGDAPAGGLAGAQVRPALAGRCRPRRGDRGGRLRREQGAAARARAVRARRAAAGHAGRRRQRPAARHRGRGSGGAARPGLRAGVSSARRPPCCAASSSTPTASGSATSPGTARRSATRSSAAADGRGCSPTGPRSPRPGGSCAARRCGSSGCRRGTC